MKGEKTINETKCTICNFHYNIKDCFYKMGVVFVCEHCLRLMIANDKRSLEDIRESSDTE